MRIPDKYIYNLLKEKEKARYGSFRELEQYLIPPHNNISYVVLKSITIIGFMGMGKTTFAAHIAEKLKNRLDIYAVAGKSIVDIVFYLKDNVDEWRGHNIFIFVDDVFYQGMSTEKTRARREAEKIYSDIRHQFEFLGFRKGILYVVFAGQRLKLIPVFFRSSPLIVLKPLIANDPYERRILLDTLTHYDSNEGVKLAELCLAILEGCARITYTKWDDRVKSITIVKPAWDYPFIYIQSSAPDPYKVFKHVEFNYSGLYEDVKNTGEDGEKILRYIVRRLKHLRKKGILKIDGNYLAVKMDGCKVFLLKKKYAEMLGII